ncbi:MAG: thioredoxin family (seleno)protein [Verrucomicrobiota bacterium]
MVEAIESEFLPVLVYNNRAGIDSELLREFGEPSWNYPVIRFLDAKKQDIIPRRDRIWTLEGVAGRMLEALSAANRLSPKYLEALAGVEVAKEPAEAAFAMFCYWTGEYRLGGLHGVITTEAGWLAGREVTRVVWDRSVLRFDELLAEAVKYDCADAVFTQDPRDAEVAANGRLRVGRLDESYRHAKVSDQKRQISGTPFEKLNLSPVQATKVNALARTNPRAALEWLSPQQLTAISKLL